MYCRSQSMSPKFFIAPVIFFLTRESCPDQVLELLVDVLGAEVARQRPCPKGSLAALCARVETNAPPPPLRFHRRFPLGCLLAISIFLFKKCCGFFTSHIFSSPFLRRTTLAGTAGPSRGIDPCGLQSWDATCRQPKSVFDF